MEEHNAALNPASGNGSANSTVDVAVSVKPVPNVTEVVKKKSILPLKKTASELIGSDNHNASHNLAQLLAARKDLLKKLEQKKTENHDMAEHLVQEAGKVHPNATDAPVATPPKVDLATPAVTTAEQNKTTAIIGHAAEPATHAPVNPEHGPQVTCIPAQPDPVKPVAVDVVAEPVMGEYHKSHMSAMRQHLLHHKRAPHLKDDSIQVEAFFK